MTLVRALILRLSAPTLVVLLSACALAATPAAARPSAPALTSAQRHYLALAQTGVAAAERRWRDRRHGWYDARLHDRDRYPLATIWDVVPLFQSLDAIAIARPSAANRRALARFASGAERYLNPGLRPVPGYSPYPGDRTADTETWFDDNGWWGLAFVEAYRATGTRRYLTDAQRALRYILAAGWDPAGGGIWWNTEHPYTAGEALASATLLATLLYQQTHSPSDLAQAQRLLAYANTAGFSQTDQLYAAGSLASTPIDYIQSPLIYAQTLLCKLRSAPSDCALADYLTANALHRFGPMLEFAPQYDAVYLQWMLALYSLNGNPALYALAVENGQRAAQSAATNGGGLYLLSWSGAPLPAQYAEPQMLQTQAATTSLFAWLAVARPPA
jgi:hypothetical protein